MGSSQFLEPERPRGELSQRGHFPTGTSEVPQESLTTNLFFRERNRGHEPRFVRGQSIRHLPPATDTQYSRFGGVPRTWWYSAAVRS